MHGSSDGEVLLEAASAHNVDVLVAWTLDPEAQGPFKRAPDETRERLVARFLANGPRHYYLIRHLPTRRPLGRFYHRALKFHPPGIDWELNILIADPGERGKGFGTTVQRLATRSLSALPETRSVFAYTHVENIAEQRAPEKAGLRRVGTLPLEEYPVVSDMPAILYATMPSHVQSGRAR
ncbi:MAG: GNAT family N-acetyltransferase [Gammaproteobacteria bacterium]